MNVISSPQKHKSLSSLAENWRFLKSKGKLDHPKSMTLQARKKLKAFSGLALKWKQRLEIKTQFITDRKRDTNSNWYSPEVMKCGKLITATKTSEINPCEKAVWKFKKSLFFLFNEDQYSGIALLLDRDEKKSLLWLYTQKLWICVLQSIEKDTPNVVYCVLWCTPNVGFRSQEECKHCQHSKGASRITVVKTS